MFAVATELPPLHITLGADGVFAPGLSVLAGEAVDVYSPDFICWLHREFYTLLPEPQRWATTKGKTQPCRAKIPRPLLPMGIRWRHPDQRGNRHRFITLPQYPRA